MGVKPSPLTHLHAVFWSEVVKRWTHNSKIAWCARVCARARGGGMYMGWKSGFVYSCDSRVYQNSCGVSWESRRLSNLIHWHICISNCVLVVEVGKQFIQTLFVWNWYIVSVRRGVVHSVNIILLSGILLVLLSVIVFCIGLFRSVVSKSKCNKSFAFHRL